MHFSAKLDELGACLPAVRWAETMPDVRTAYEKCPSGLWLEWLLIRVVAWHEGLEHEYNTKYKRLHVEVLSKVVLTDDEYWAKVADLIRSIVPVEVFLDIFKESRHGSRLHFQHCADVQVLRISRARGPRCCVSRRGECCRWGA